MKFIHLTDLHLVLPGQKLWGNIPFERLDACLEDITAYHSDAEFCVISGDLTDRGDLETYHALRDRLERFPLKTILMLGNHDERIAYFNAFPDASRDENGFAQQILDTSKGRFIFMDTFGEPRNSAGWYCPLRQGWFKEQLSSAPGDIYIAMHHPPFDIGIKYMDRIKLVEHKAFAELVAQADRVHHIFFGHVHRALFGTWRGITYSALPALNHQVPLTPGSVAHPYSDEPPMYAIVSVDDDQMRIHCDGFWDRRELPEPPGDKKR